MSKTREASTLTVTVLLVGASFGSMALIDRFPTATLLPFGALFAFIAIFQHELAVLQDSFEGRNKKRKRYPAIEVRFMRSVIVGRVVPTLPLFMWSYLNGGNLLVTLIILGTLAVALSVIEHKWLWD